MAVTVSSTSISGKAIGGRTAALGSMYLVTGLLSEVLTNNAAAALMYPIAANVGDDMQIQVGCKAPPSPRKQQQQANSHQQTLYGISPPSLSMTPNTPFDYVKYNI